MGKSNIDVDNAVFVLLSFEGPDIYSQAGGLGVRITHLSRALSEKGFLTHLFFIGDPGLKGEEVCHNGKLVLHRWCQWISAYHPAGVYQGEYEKLSDYTASIPEYLLENVIKPASNDGKIIVVLAEEWHTVSAVCRLDRLLKNYGLRERVVLFWNANNTFGFEHIDFPELSRAATITTVSRFMKQTMWNLGLNPIVIPNGIPRFLLNRIDSSASAKLRQGLAADLILAKIARWDPDKRWNMAVEAAARLKARGMRTVLIARGGLEGYGEEIIYNARSLGLRVTDIISRDCSLDNLLETVISSASQADMLNLKFHCSQDFLRIIYHASNAILANSGREPFGLVGLETMAAGGIAFTGSTGEDYTIPFYNSIVLETSDPKEIETYVMFLAEHPEDDNRIRKAARFTAGRFTWEQIIDNLIQRLEYQARLQGIIATPVKKPLFGNVPAGFIRDFQNCGNALNPGIARV